MLCQLPADTPDLLAEPRIAGKASNDSAESRGERAGEITEEALRGELGRGAERQILLCQLPAYPPDLLAEPRIAGKPPDHSAERWGERADDVAEKALRSELGCRVERQILPCELAAEIAQLLAEACIAREPAERSAEAAAELTCKIAEKALRGELRRCAERQILPAELACHSAELLAKRWIAGEAADRAPDGRSQSPGQIAEKALG